MILIHTKHYSSKILSRTLVTFTIKRRLKNLVNS